MKNNTAKGYIFAFIATICFSNVYIFSKAALNEVHLSLFGFQWYAVSGLLCLLFAAKNKRLGILKNMRWKEAKILLILGFLEIITTTLFFLSIHIIPDPSVTSFLGNMYPVMVTLGGIIILKERFGWIEIGGIVLALTGAFIISYTGGTSPKTLFIHGTGVVFLNAVFATAATLVVKTQVKNISPEILNLNRSFWLFLFAGVMIFVYNTPMKFYPEASANIAIGAALEFLAILTAYYSFSYIEVSRSSIVQSLKGIIVLIIGYLIFRTLPLPHQLLGGALTIAGVLVMTLAQSGILRKTSVH
jgi:drug/metabolite transporter (DMT)-like permease